MASLSRRRGERRPGNWRLASEPGSLDPPLPPIRCLHRLTSSPAPAAQKASRQSVVEKRAVTKELRHNYCNLNSEVAVCEVSPGVVVLMVSQCTRCLYGY
ncbi:hypothetical protein U9M48_043919 [Paspalum notatum var. saurae]|uniref:Uncharacterized protein n=1 Tax=Paspalum notatum var. saurae TaxID=547442 RepID=A0AAQ3UY59_PASNO